jgi:hypothetical protein
LDIGWGTAMAETITNDGPKINLVTNSLKRPAEMYRSPRTRPYEH